MIRALVIGNLVISIGLAAYIFLKPAQQGKIVYVMNNEVFAGFKGKQLLEGKLKDLQHQHKMILDSMILQVQSSNKQEVLQHYRMTEERLRSTEQSVSEQYTADIWKRINTYLLDFGKENRYTFVFGASGDGNLMYADDAANVTQEAIQFINAKYEAEE